MMLRNLTCCSLLRGASPRFISKGSLFNSALKSKLGSSKFGLGPNFGKGSSFSLLSPLRSSALFSVCCVLCVNISSRMSAGGTVGNEPLCHLSLLHEQTQFHVPIAVLPLHTTQLQIKVVLSTHCNHLYL